MSKIPSQIFITAKSTNLGFLNGYAPGSAAFEKKLTTQFEWAYGDRINSPTFTYVDDILFVSGHRYTWDGTTNVRTDISEPVAIQPIILDNTPRHGFKILNSVSRYSTSNKLWRVLDPIGIEFEISTASFENIVLHGSIVRGVIQEACVWASNKNLIVTGD